MPSAPKKQPRTPRQPRHTPAKTLAGMDERDGHRCAWHIEGECDPETLVPQHRQGGMGGRRGKHRLSNLVWLCSLVNGLIEDSPMMQRLAYERGIKIRNHADPTVEPVTHAVLGRVVLDDDGGWEDY